MAFLIELSIVIFAFVAFGWLFFCLVVGTGQFNTGQPDEGLVLVFFVIAFGFGVLVWNGLSVLYQYFGWL